MATSLLSLLLTLLGQSFDIIPPDMNHFGNFSLYQQPLLVASPYGRSSWESYHLQGSVKELQLGFSFVTDKATTPCIPLQTLQFDTHGYLTEMVRYSTIGEGNAIRKEMACTIANQFTAQGQLQKATCSFTQPKESRLFSVERSYGEQGRLTEMYATFTDPSVDQEKQESIKIPMTFDKEGRLAEQCIWLGTNDKLQMLCNSAYHYSPNGSTIVESTFGLHGKVAQRRWYNAAGLLIEWHAYGDKGKATSKMFFKYNVQGDIQRISNIRANHKDILEFDDYVYDTSGNWIERKIFEGDGAPTRSSEVVQYRKIAYFAQTPSTDKVP